MKCKVQDILPGATKISDLFETGHVCVSGMTGSGKTTFTQTVGPNSGLLVVFFDTDDEGLMKDADVDVSNAAELRRAIAKGHRMIRVEAASNPDAAVQQLESVRLLLWELADRIRDGRRSVPPWVLVIIPEAHELAPSASRDGPLHRIMRRGRKRGIRALVDTQSPSTVSTTITRQCRHHVIFELSPFERPYFQTVGLPHDEVEPWVRQPHHFVLAKGQHWAPMYPLRIE